MQYLNLPINNMQITADYKVQVYKNKFGFEHYGGDCVEKNRQTRNVYGMGNGIVVACGMDGANAKDRLGNCIVIVYNDVKCNDNSVKSLACRMFHFDKILCKTGDAITSDTIIGEYGNTGKYSNGAHLHIEFDTDIKYPCHAVGIASSGKVIKQGSKDSTISPFAVLWLGKNQTVYATLADISLGWVKNESVALPTMDDTDLKNQLEITIAERDNYNKLLNSIRELLRL